MFCNPKLSIEEDSDFEHEDARLQNASVEEDIDSDEDDAGTEDLISIGVIISNKMDQMSIMSKKQV